MSEGKKTLPAVVEDENRRQGVDMEPEAAHQPPPPDAEEEEELLEDSEEVAADFAEFVQVDNDGGGGDDDGNKPGPGDVSELFSEEESESEATDSLKGANTQNVMNAASPLIQFETIRPPLQRQLVSSISRGDRRQSFWGRMDDDSMRSLDTKKTAGKGHRRVKSDFYHDYSEANQELLTFLADSGKTPIKVDIPSLSSCRRKLQNKEADQHHDKARKWYWRVADTASKSADSFF